MSLPDHAQRWLDWLITELELELPVETLATCSDCPMAKPDLRGPSAFSPISKCCTYTPTLPNFLFGRALATRPELIEVQPTQLRTPLGVFPRPDHAARFQAMLDADLFGRDPSMRCPYHDDAGGCGIWPARNGDCSTWFCVSSHGPRGSSFWAATRELLRFIEVELSRWCVRERGLDPALAGSDDAQAWAHWSGREAAFYRECAASVDALDQAALERLLPDPLRSVLCDAVVQEHRLV